MNDKQLSDKLKNAGLLPKHDVTFAEQVLVRNMDISLAKFHEGAAHHGGSIFDRDTLREAKEEARDLFFYLESEDAKRTAFLEYYKSDLNRVKEFFTTFGIEFPDKPDFNWDLISKKILLVKEEYLKLCEALGQEDKQGLLDALVDLRYVIANVGVIAGLDLDEAMYRIHKNNMKKFWTEEEAKKIPDDCDIFYPAKTDLFSPVDKYIVKRKIDGKVVKPPNHPAPDLSDLIGS